MLNSIPEHILKHINNLVKHEVIIKIQEIIKKEKTQFLENMSEKTLEDLIHFYYIIDEHNEVIKITHILNQKKIFKTESKDKLKELKETK
jgi:hypothetical protein